MCPVFKQECAKRQERPEAYAVARATKIVYEHRQVNVVLLGQLSEFIPSRIAVLVDVVKNEVYARPAKRGINTLGQVGR